MSADATKLSAIVVGGSLSGLSAAIRLAREGVRVTVLERSITLGTVGGGLGVSRAQLSRVLGASAFGDGQTPALPVIGTRREAMSWMGLHGWLTELAARTSLIRTLGGQRVLSVASVPGGVNVRTEGGTYDADLVIGADGYNSTVRASIAPDHPHASYAGYILWRGLIEEGALPAGMMPEAPLETASQWAGRHRLVAYQVPGEDGGTAPGRRRVNWAWYDADRTALLHSLGIVDAGRVVRSLSPAEMPGDVAADLLFAAGHLWSDPWRAAIQASIRQDRVFGTPIAEYVPVRLAQGRVALVGDAAHVSTPMVGTGFGYGLDDVDALARSVCRDPGDLDSALVRYQRERLRPDRALAQEGMDASRYFLAHIRDQPAMRRPQSACLTA